MAECARCSGPMLHKSVEILSKYDNKTPICVECSMAEIFLEGHLIPLDVSLYSDEAVRIRQEHKNTNRTQEGHA